LSDASGVAARRGSTRAVYYRDKQGVEPVDDFVEQLMKANPMAAAKIDDYVEEHLNRRAAGDPPPEHPVSSQIEGELRELRVRFARTRYRVLYRRSGNLIVLLHAFEKHTGRVPVGEQRLAARRFEDFKARMDAKPRRRPRAAGHDAPVKTRRSGP